MKKNLVSSFLIIISALLLSSCSANDDEISKTSGSAETCTPISDIFTKGDPNILHPKLSIVDTDTGKTKGVITWVADKVTSVVRTAGLKIYLKIALNLDFRFTVAIMMTMAVILFASSVMLGLIQANGYNALMFVLKLIIIYNLTINYYYFDVYVIESFEGLISDAMMFTSFTFSDYVAPTGNLACFGLIGAACNPVSLLSSIFGLQAIGDLLNLLGVNISSTDISAFDRFTLFGAMDDQLSSFFDFRYWKMILAVSATGYTGILWGLMLFILMATYFFAIIIAVKTFLMATIARFVLYGLGPIFLSFALFNQTRSLFDGWLQQLISFTLQPVFLFIFLGMFHSVLAGFSERIYSSLSNNNDYKVTTICPLSDTTGCTSKPCTTTDPAYCDIPNNMMWTKTSSIASSGMFICWGSFDKASKLNWYRLCNDATGKNCEDQSGISPIIPIDIWAVLAGIIVCYLMISMCHWVVDIANYLAGGAITLSQVKIQGFDRIKMQAKSGINNSVKGLFRTGPPTGTR